MEQTDLHPPQSCVLVIHRPHSSVTVEKGTIMHSAKNSRSSPDGRENTVLVMPQRNYKPCNNHTATTKWKTHYLENWKAKGHSDKLTWLVSTGRFLLPLNAENQGITVVYHSEDNQLQYSDNHFIFLTLPLPLFTDYVATCKYAQSSDLYSFPTGDSSFCKVMEAKHKYHLKGNWLQTVRMKFGMKTLVLTMCWELHSWRLWESFKTGPRTSHRRAVVQGFV